MKVLFGRGSVAQLVEQLPLKQLVVGSSPTGPTKVENCTHMNENKVTGVWRSWLARVVWDDEAGGSSPLTPTKKRVELMLGFFLV